MAKQKPEKHVVYLNDTELKMARNVLENALYHEVNEMHRGIEDEMRIDKIVAALHAMAYVREDDA
jgi:hypothetical protein